MYLQSQDFFLPPYYLQPEFLNDAKKSMFLEIKKEREPKFFSKKKDRDLAEAKGEKKNKRNATKTNKKKIEKKKK